MLSLPVEFFIELFVRGVVLCLLSAIGLIVCRRTAAAYRHVLCVLALCGLLILPLAQRLMPPLLLLTPQPAASPKLVTVPMEEPSRLSDTHSKPEIISLPMTTQKEIAWTVPAAALPPASAVPMRKEAVNALPARQERSLNTTAVLFIIWGLGTAILLIRLMAALFSLRKLAAESQTAMLGNVPILIGTGVETPLTWGIRSHIILMPAALVSGEPAVCESALRHEQAHIARWDWAWNLLAEIACAFCWFQPGVWWLRRRMRLESERACDDRVLLSGITGPDYAAHLLCILRSGCFHEIAPAMAQSGGMEERMRHILDTNKPRRARLIWLVLAAQFGLVLLLLSALRVSARPVEVSRDRTFTGHSQSVNAVVFSPDSKRLLTGSADGTAIVWNVTDGRSILTLKGSTAAITRALYSPNGKRIITGFSDGAIHVWNAATGEQRHSLSGPGGAVRALDISSDGTKLLGGYENGTVKIWNTGTGQELAAFAYDNPLLSAAISQDGKSLAAGYSDATLKVWDIQTQHSLISEKIPESEAVTGVHFEPSDTLYTWDRQKSKDGKPKTTFMTAWYIRPRQILLKVGFSFPPSMISHVVTYDNLKMLYGLSEGQAVFHNPHGNPVTLDAHDGPVAAVAISPDGTLGATGGMRNGKGEAKLWDIQAREPAKPIEENLQLDKAATTKQPDAGKSSIKEVTIKEASITKASIRKPGVSASRQLISADPTMTTNQPNRAPASRSVADPGIASGNVIWGEGVDGLQPGFLPNAHKFANNLFPYNYKVVYRVLVRNTSDRERTFEVHSQDHTGIDPYLIPDGDIRKALDGGKISEEYRARGVYDEREVFLGYVVKLAAGEAVMLPEVLSLYMGDAVKNNYPRMENIKEGSNWIVQPVIVRSLNAEEMVQAEANKKIDITVLNRDGIPVTRSATQFPVQPGGTTLFAKMQSMAGPRSAAVVNIADVVWGEIVDGLQPGFLLNGPGFSNNRVPYNSNVVYRVLVRNATNRERVFEARCMDYIGPTHLLTPYLLPDDIYKALGGNKIPEDYRARGVTDLSLGFPGYAMKLAPGESVVLPKIFSLYIGDAGKDNYPRIEMIRIKAGNNWIVQPVMIRSMTAEEVADAESIRKSPYVKNFAVTTIDRHGKTSQRYVTLFGAKAEGKTLYAKIQLEIGTLPTKALMKADKAVWGKVDRGLQCGIRLLNPKRTFQVGDTLEAELLWRNTTTSPITTVLPRTLDLYPLIHDAKGRELQIDFGAQFEIYPMSHTYEPGEVRSLGVTAIKLVVRGTPSPLDLRQEPGHISLAPGAYKLSGFGGVSSNGGGNPTSGDIEFRVVGAGSVLPNEDGISWGAERGGYRYGLRIMDSVGRLEIWVQNCTADAKVLRYSVWPPDLSGSFEVRDSGERRIEVPLPGIVQVSRTDRNTIRPSENARLYFQSMFDLIQIPNPGESVPIPEGRVLFKPGEAYTIEWSSGAHRTGRVSFRAPIQNRL